MSTIITAGAATIAPTLVLGYESEREAGTIVHPILGRSNPDVTLRPAGLRTGTLELGFQGTASEADSLTAATLLAAAGTFAVVSTDRASVQMTFVVTGSIRRALEPESRDAWLVTFGYQEVSP